MAAVRFYFDFISPYAYLSWAALQPLARRAGRAVEPVPVLFAGLLNHHGQVRRLLPPSSRPPSPPPRRPSLSPPLPLTGSPPTASSNA